LGGSFIRDLVQVKRKLGGSIWGGGMSKINKNKL